MRKYVVFGGSLLAVLLLMLGPQTTVVGYQTFHDERQSLIQETKTQKDLLFQTLCDLANNHEMQRLILQTQRTSSVFSPALPTSRMPTISKKDVALVFVLGTILSRTLSTQTLKATSQRQSLTLTQRQQIATIIHHDAVLQQEAQQLSSLDCHCQVTSVTLKDAVCFIDLVIHWISYSIAEGLASLGLVVLLYTIGVVFAALYFVTTVVYVLCCEYQYHP